MGTEYKVFEDKETGIEISLYEMSCEFYVCVSSPVSNEDHVNGSVNASTNKKYTEDEILDMAASLIGPLYYFSDNPKNIFDTLLSKLKARGYT